MTGYVKTTTNGQVIEYPYGGLELMRDNPGLGYTPFSDAEEIFPTTDAYKIHGFRIYPVTVDPDPAYDGQAQTVSRSEHPFVRDGNWVFSWIVRNFTPEEIAHMEEMKAKMNVF